MSIKGEGRQREGGEGERGGKEEERERGKGKEERERGEAKGRRRGREWREREGGEGERGGKGKEERGGKGKEERGDRIHQAHTLYDTLHQGLIISAINIMQCYEEFRG
jgi:hypothetical protein